MIQADKVPARPEHSPTSVNQKRSYKAFMDKIAGIMQRPGEDAVPKDDVPWWMKYAGRGLGTVGSMSKEPYNSPFWLTRWSLLSQTAEDGEIEVRISEGGFS
uniref:Uncharacterized protein n=1 Tax=Timema tahoe TaxID=61484 RepID=A0A7R9FH55_9NEOP|nr:unnamed protein product [Timema tahoe]